MKKILYYLLVIVVAGFGLVSFWVYQKYFQQEKPKFLTFNVERGDIQESVKVRGEIVSQKTFNLEFPFSGTVSDIFVSEGQTVKAGSPLIKLETTDFNIDLQNMQAALAQEEANLKKLIAGPTAEDIRVAETKVTNAETALEDANNNLVDKLKNAYNASDDAVRNKADQLFVGPQTLSPHLSFQIIDLSLKSDVESARRYLETNLFDPWEASVKILTTSSDLYDYLKIYKGYLDQVKSFLDKMGAIVDNPVNTAVTSDWRTSVSTARTKVNAAITDLLAAEEKNRNAESDLALSKQELVYKKAGTRPEDIEIAEAKIDAAKSQIASVREKIRKSALYAPIAAKITKIWLEKGEIFRPGEAAISLFSTGYKIQADISELEIGKIQEAGGNDVSIQFDAFPDEKFTGKVLSVEPQEVVKDGDKYYRVNVSFDDRSENVRSGMSADLVIPTSFKSNVLKIPLFAVFEQDGLKFVKVLEDGVQKDAKIETGISDGDNVEVIQGLNEGQKVIVSTE